MLAAVTADLPVPRRVLALASRLAEVPGVVGGVLGGSRAIGAHRPASDVDLGISEIGGWGPWVNGGAWLVVGETRVDWIYRDLDARRTG